MTTILFVNDDREVGEAARSYLSAMGYHVALAATGAAAMRALSSFHADLIVWDSGIADVPAADFCRWLRSHPQRATTPLVFTMPPGHLGLAAPPLPAGQEARQEVIRKPFQWEAMASAVQRLTGSTNVAPPAFRVGGLALDNQTNTLSLQGRGVTLTQTEFRLLLYLAQEAATVVTVEELLEKVWGFYPGTGSRELVRQHIRNLRRKLVALPGGREMIQTFPRRGYRLVPPQ